MYCYVCTDGSMETVGSLSEEGKWKGKTLAFTSRTIPWLEFQVTKSKGKHVGLADIAVFEKQTQLRN